MSSFSKYFQSKTHSFPLLIFLFVVLFSQLQIHLVLVSDHLLLIPSQASTLLIIPKTLIVILEGVFIKFHLMATATPVTSELVVASQRAYIVVPK